MTNTALAKTMLPRPAPATNQEAQRWLDALTRKLGCSVLPPSLSPGARAVNGFFDAMYTLQTEAVLHCNGTFVGGGYYAGTWLTDDGNTLDYFAAALVDWHPTRLLLGLAPGIGFAACAACGLYHDTRSVFAVVHQVQTGLARGVHPICQRCAYDGSLNLDKMITDKMITVRDRTVAQAWASKLGMSLDFGSEPDETVVATLQDGECVAVEQVKRTEPKCEFCGDPFNQHEPSIEGLHLTCITQLARREREESIATAAKCVKCSGLASREGLCVYCFRTWVEEPKDGAFNSEARKTPCEKIASEIRATP